MIYLIFGIFLLLAPSLWVQWVMRRYRQPEDRYIDCGNGAELARHLLDRCGLDQVKVEETPLGDHYDPEARAVRLLPVHYYGYSLAAVVVAAHEVGHAIQHHQNLPLFYWRHRLAKTAFQIEQMATLLLLILPPLFIVLRVPLLALIVVLLRLITMGTTVIVHLLTLPLEWDASFRCALPLLQREGHLFPPDYPHARKLLNAAALTYFAGALFSLLNLSRWIRIGR